jgi:hypothetical protein
VPCNLTHKGQRVESAEVNIPRPIDDVLATASGRGLPLPVREYDVLKYEQNHLVFESPSVIDLILFEEAPSAI